MSLISGWLLKGAKFHNVWNLWLPWLFKIILPTYNLLLIQNFTT